MTDLLWFELLLVEESASQHLLAERDNVWRVCQVEVLVTPELPRRPATGLHLVYDVSQPELETESMTMTMTMTMTKFY